MLDQISKKKRSRKNLGASLVEVALLISLIAVVVMISVAQTGASSQCTFLKTNMLLSIRPGGTVVVAGGNGGGGL